MASASASLVARDAATDALVAFYANFIDTKYLAAATFTWVAYDTVTTVDESIELFWKSRWTISKILYILVRYDTMLIASFGIMGLFWESPPASFCAALPWIQTFLILLLIATMNVTLILRTYALWGRSLILLCVLSTMVIANLTTWLSITLKALTATGAGGFVQAAPYTGCFSLYVSDIFWAAFIPTLVLESTVIVLTIVKAWGVANLMSNKTGMRTPIYTTLLQGGIAYYFVITGSKFFVIIASYVPSIISLPVLIANPTLIVVGLACRRLIAHLQRLVVPGVVQGPSGILTVDHTSAGISTDTYARPRPKRRHWPDGFTRTDDQELGNIKTVDTTPSSGLGTSSTLTKS